MVSITITRANVLVHKFSIDPKKHAIPEYSLNMFIGYELSSYLAEIMKPYLNRESYTIVISEEKRLNYDL